MARLPLSRKKSARIVGREGIEEFISIKERCHETHLALLLPFLVFLTLKRPFQGILCFLLQITLSAAAIWAVYALSQFKTDKIDRGGFKESGKTVTLAACAAADHDSTADRRACIPRHVRPYGAVHPGLLPQARPWSASTA